MVTTPPSMLVLIAILATAFAQILLKKASYYEIKTVSWLLCMGVSAVSYTASFILYSRVLKYFALNKIYPAMTIVQIILVTLYGLSIGEGIGGRHALGLLFGILSVYLMFL